MTLFEIHLDGVRLGGSPNPTSSATDEREAEMPVADESTVSETRSESGSESRSRSRGRSAGRRVARLVAGTVVVALIARTVSRRVRGRGRGDEQSSLEDAEFVPVDAEDEAPTVDDR